MITCSAYIRVSSRTQDHATQRAAIERAARARGDVIGEWYAEKKSARTLAREELTRLRADARAGHVRKLFVFRIDRLARSGIRDTFEVVEELRGHGVEIVTVADGFSFDGPAAEVVLAVMAWAARMENLARSERRRERLGLQPHHALMVLHRPTLFKTWAIRPRTPVPKMYQGAPLVPTRDPLFQLRGGEPHGLYFGRAPDSPRDSRTAGS